MNEDFPIKDWEWIIYAVGWIAGVFSLLFWAFLYIMYLSRDDHEKFFNRATHRRIYYWGWFSLSVLVTFLAISFFI